ncbi:sensor histidine kinase [Bacillus salitolerans]|uniref:histidine kinase n=1 Tax=Bacillus salitolerans TaxID=1437434 RepID=A0ABW4LSH5_9BACI
MKSVPKYYEMMRTTCIFEECQFAPMPPTTTEELSKLNITGDNYAFLFVLMDTLLILYFYMTALIVFWKCFSEPMGLFAGLMLVSFGTAFPSLVGVAGENINFIFVLGWTAFIVFFMIFPNGRFFPNWTSIIAGTYIGIQILGLLFPESFFNILMMPIWLKSVMLLIPLLTMGFSQIYRFIKVSDSTERQQTKWVVYGFALTLVGFIFINFLYVPGIMKGALSYLYLNAFINLCMAIIPTTLTFAILKHRLWDIDPIVNRTLVYGVLSLCVILIYIVPVSYLSRIFQTKDNMIISLIATALVAIVFAPLKARLQRLINRILYGKKDEPFSVLANLSQQWEKPMTVEATIDVVAATIRESLRLPYTAISFTIDSRDTVVAASGTAIGDVSMIPIIYRGETLGSLLICPRSPGEELGKDDRQLLDVLIRQSGPIIQGIKMSVGMKLLVEEVQESRGKLVLAREEERRKIRRNLHDDLAPRLAALALNVATAERFVSKDPSLTVNILTELKQTIRSTVNDIRKWVHDLRPPALDELGLIGAIEQRIQELTKTTHQLSESLTIPTVKVEFKIEGRIPILPAAVEVAIYRIVTESLVNVVRHSSAKHCTIKIISEEDAYICMEIVDDGIGLGEHRMSFPNGGIGMQSMREQAVELGGTCTIETRIEGGVRIFTILPYERREM